MTARDELAQFLAGGDAVFYEPQRTFAYASADALIAAGWRKMPSLSAIAKALFDVRDDEFDDEEWDDLSAVDRERWECDARAILALMDGDNK